MINFDSLGKVHLKWLTFSSRGGMNSLAQDLVATLVGV